APAMRVGALVAPKIFIERAASIKSAYNMQASGFNQAITAEFLNPKAKFFAGHLETLRTAYGQRYDCMAKSLATYLPKDAGYRYTAPRGGMFIYVTGPNSVDFVTMFDTALAQGVAYVPGSIFYMG